MRLPKTTSFGRGSLVRIFLGGCAAFFMTALFSCSTQYLEISHKDNITAEKLEHLKKGVATKAEIESAFGEPIDRVLVTDGERYFYKDFNLRSVYLEFDKRGVLVDYEHSK
jgi:pyruvate/2-oxoglutarate dehydrogenase complex dihydrolipoamide dehydrogenase (E3) component